MIRIYIISVKMIQNKISLNLITVVYFLKNQIDMISAHIDQKKIKKFLLRVIKISSYILYQETGENRF